MRVKSRWFRAGRKSAEEIAGAAGFIAWRIAQNALKKMRSAGYDLPAGTGYFDFLAAFLAFLVVGADRIAYRAGDGDWRVAFITAMANRAGEVLAENHVELLAGADAPEVKRLFVDLVNECAAESADCDWDDDGPDYGFLRYFGHRVAAVMGERDRTWAVSQFIEVEGPDAAATLRRGMSGLLDESPRKRERGTHASGE
ncbi:MAG: hypothetical protein U1F54_13795 [Burkholderiales bacterium]